MKLTDEDLIEMMSNAGSIDKLETVRTLSNAVLERLIDADVEPDHECPSCHHQQRSITYTCNNCGCGVDVEYQANFTATSALAALQAENERLREDAGRLNRIAWLIGSIYVHGNFKAETFNERELEKLLRENGTFWDTLQEFDAARAALETKA